jgi:ubiquinone/menaquinone biosynthesis C-methylase UbiE
MNMSHSGVTDWGLSHLEVNPTDWVLDVGCGGGRTVNKLAERAAKVCGIDHSPDSVTHSTKLNHALIDNGRVESREGSVSHLPFPDSTFNVVTAVETHFFWPDLPGDMREILRVIKPGGSLLIVAEVYRGADSVSSRLMEKHGPRIGLKLLTEEEHRALFENAGFVGTQVFTEPKKGWICAIGKKAIST